jgi:hypothetical protein
MTIHDGLIVGRFLSSSKRQFDHVTALAI